MEYTKYRKYPRAHKKSAPEEDERTLTLSTAAAVGILAAIFIKGMFWGYLIKKKMGD